MSDELKQFFREIHGWVNDGCPEHKRFDRRHSLCFAAERWFRWSLCCDFGTICVAEEEMRKLFKKVDCEHFDFPFNAGPKGWMSELEGGDFYQNPKRLAFIKEHAK